MQRSDIGRAATSAVAVCTAYLQNPAGAEEALRLHLAASNIAALFDRPDEELADIRSLVLHAAVLARIVVTHLRSSESGSDKAIRVQRAATTWEAALLKLAREVGRMPEGNACGS
jgi:hypothetical protein